MPELPEVEFGRRVARSVAQERRIVEVRCARDPIVFDGVSPQRVRRALLGRTVMDVQRRGKYLWFELDERPWPLFHFGMTGSFRVPGGSPLKYESSPAVEPSFWPPRFTKIRMHFDDGGELVMTNARRLGRIRLRDDPPREPPVARLGFDPLLELPTPARFRDALRRRSGKLKGVFLDQSFAAGVGNWMADEVLYQAGVAPSRTVASLTDAEVERARRALGRIVRHAVKVDADKKRFPRSWLFHYRWGRAGGARLPGGEAVEFTAVAGRTTAWVPGRQR